MLQVLAAQEASGCPSASEITQESLDKLVYLDCCFTEALRMCSGSIIMRMVRNPLQYLFMLQVVRLSIFVREIIFVL